jgi:hypothetical protein
MSFTAILITETYAALLVMWNRKLCKCDRKWELQDQKAFYQLTMLIIASLYLIFYPLELQTKNQLKRHNIMTDCEKPCDFVDLLFQKGLDKSFKTLIKFNENQNVLIFPSARNLKHSKVNNNYIKKNCERMRAKISFEKVHQLNSENIENAYFYTKALLLFCLWLGFHGRESRDIVPVLILMPAMFICLMLFFNNPYELNRVRNTVISFCDRKTPITCDRFEDDDTYQTVYFTEEFYNNFC